MTLVARLSPGVEERVDFVVSPLFEALMSLHVLRSPEHHPLSHPYVRRMRDWPAALRRDLARFAFAFQSAPAAVGLPLVGVDRASFADELAVLRQATDAQATAFFARTHYLAPGGPSLDLRCAPQMTARFFCDMPPSRASLAFAEQAVYRPREMLLEFADVLERYWEAAFEAQWRSHLPDIETAITKARHRLASGIESFLRPLWPEVRLGTTGYTFYAKRLPDHDVTIGPGDRLRLVPSLFVWPNVRMYCERPGQLVLAYPPAAVVAPVAAIRPPSTLLTLLTALADDTRLRALHYLSQQPRSTQELAPLVGVRASTLSDHLHKLKDAGILRSRRDGYYVMYEIATDVGDLVGRVIDDYLERPAGTRPAGRKPGARDAIPACDDIW